jgi:hypothetical protein
MRFLGVCGIGVAAGLAAGLALLGGCNTGSGTLSGTGGGGIINIGGSTGSTFVTPTGSGGVKARSCGVGTVAAKVPPDVLIVLDTATSMNDPIDGPCETDCGARSKWAASVAAINAVVGATSTTVSWGLAFLGRTDDVCEAAGVTASLGASAAGVQQALASRTTSGVLAVGTNRPTRAALTLATAYLSGRDLGPPKVILLITDGQPACKPGAADALADDGPGAIRAVGDAAVRAVSTFVVGLATTGGPADATLREMAALGDPFAAMPATYFPAAGSAGIIAAMNAVVGMTAVCTFAVPPPPTDDGTTSRADISVTADQTTIMRDATNGWRYADTSLTAIQLRGAACEAVRNGTVKTIGISFNCPHGA